LGLYFASFVLLGGHGFFHQLHEGMEESYRCNKLRLFINIILLMLSLFTQICELEYMVPLWILQVIKEQTWHENNR